MTLLTGTATAATTNETAGRTKRSSSAGASYRILIADAIVEDGLTPLAQADEIELIERTSVDDDELAAALAEADAVIVRSSTTITRRALAGAERLKVIGRAGVGVDNIDVEAATERGIAVLNAPSGNTISAAELTMALLLSLMRRVPAADRSMRAGEWDRKRFRGEELRGKALGLVGAGRIGGEVARRARAFGMQVIAHDPYLSEERADALEVDLAELDELLARADVVSVHVPLTDATAGLIGAERLATMKEGAYLVNAARGGVVDEAALVEALESGHLAGAAIDVYAVEPLPEHHPLRRSERVVLTPHLGAATVEAQQGVAREIAEAVRDALLHGDLSRALNAPAIGGEELRRMRPLLDLAERLGRLGSALADGPIASVELRYAGGADDGLRPLTASALVGVLEAIVGRRAVNFVNAPHLAAARDIEVRRVRRGPHGDYGEYLELVLAGRDGETRVAGALLAASHPRVVRILDFHVDIPPHGTLVVLRNRDVPGVIGRVGTVLGDTGVNIAEYHQARREAGGEALAAITVDGRLDSGTVDALRRVSEVLEVRQAQLD
ncbi:MAG: phosphoglycerate dehydrogenase [Gemmatimonadota bacterium]